MSPVSKELERKAMELSPEEREELAGNLLRSLDNAPLTAIDAAWVTEAERRYEEVKSGKIQAVPGDAAFQKIRQQLGW